jgi:electron transfer flavoprotein beta subunit
VVTDRPLGGADTLATSYTLAQAIKKIGEFDIIIGGRQAIDGDTAQVGPQIAEKLGLTQVTYAEEIISLDEKARKVVIKRHIDGGVETVEAPLPLVVTVNGSAAPCRPRNAKRVMKYKYATVALEREGNEKLTAAAEKKPYLDITQWGAADIDCDPQQIGKAGSPTNVKKVENIVFKAKESRTMTGSDEDINALMKELIAEKIIG